MSAIELDLVGYQAAMDSGGVRSDPRLQLRFSRAQGYHFCAVGDIPAGTLLAAVPLSITLDLSPDGSDAAELGGLGIPPLCISALLLQLELIAGKRLPLQHIKLLRELRIPQNVLQFGEVHQRVLQATTLQGASMHLRERYDTVVEPFLKAAPATSRFGTPELLAEGFEGFKRAAALVMSRCFHADGSENAATPSTLAGVFEAAGSAATVAGDSVKSSASPSGPILAPYFDLFNHDTHFASTHNARVADEFHLYALRPIQAQGEVFLSYGQLSDAQLLHTYGYIPENDNAKGVRVRNPHNTVQITSSGVLVAVRDALRTAGELDAGRAKVVNAAAALLRRSDLLCDAGFILGDCEIDAAEQPWLFLTTCVPRTLFTCLQVLTLDAPSFVEYKLSAQGEALLLPVPQASSQEHVTPVASTGVMGSSTSIGDSSSDSGSSDEDSDDSALEREDAAATWVALLAVLKQKQASYSTSLQEDLDWYSASGPSCGAQSSTDVHDQTGRTAFPLPESDTITPTTHSRQSPVKRPRLVGAAASGPEGDAFVEISGSSSDPLLRNCRILAMREKEFLSLLVSAVVSELKNLSS